MPSIPENQRALVDEAIVLTFANNHALGDFVDNLLINAFMDNDRASVIAYAGERMIQAGAMLAVLAHEAVCSDEDCKLNGITVPEFLDGVKENAPPEEDWAEFKEKVYSMVAEASADRASDTIPEDWSVKND